jgi:asparagine synthase (glutamine-hydrolysing)
VERRCRPGERVGLQLSGGLDSRAILAAMPKTDTPIHALTFGTIGDPEIEIAAQAAKIKSHPPSLLSAGRQLLNGRRDLVWQLDGELNVIHAHFICRCRQ